MVFRRASFNYRVFYRIIIMMVLVCSVVPSFAGELDRVRIWAGLELFPAMVAADEGIHDKKSDDNTLSLLFVYRDLKKDAHEMAGHVKQIGMIRDLAISVTVVSYTQLSGYDRKAIGGVFLTQHPGEFCDDVIRFGQKNHALIFSPFEGDVENGISGGILISDIIKPYVNTDALNKAHLSLKPFFLRVAEHYDP